MAALLVEPWLSVQAIILFGSIIQSAGVIASSFAPNITWMTITLGVVHGNYDHRFIFYFSEDKSNFSC